MLRLVLSIFALTVMFAFASCDSGNTGNGGEEPTVDIEVHVTLETDGPYSEGQEINYELVIANAGSLVATNVEVVAERMNLSTHDNSVSGACSEIPCTISDPIQPGDELVISVRLDIPSTDEVGTFDYIATAAPEEVDANVDNNSDRAGGNIEPSDRPAYFRSVGFANAERGWAGSLFNRSKRLYQTTNGGATFENITSRIEPAIRGGICGLWVVDEQIAYGTGAFHGPAHVIKTTDGGQSWDSYDMSDFADGLIDVYFWNATRGIVVGVIDGSPTILMTEDGGVSWNTKFIGSIEGMAWKISFPTPDVGYVSVESVPAGGDGYVIKTEDGGNSWSGLFVEGGSRLINGIGFITPDTGWEGGDGVFQTLDGGLTWEPMELDGGSHINRLRFLESGVGFAVDKPRDGSAVYRIEADNGSEIPNWHLLTEEVGGDDIFFVDENRGWVAEGEGGRIYRTLDGGASWEIVVDEGDATFAERYRAHEDSLMAEMIGDTRSVAEL